MMVEHRVRADGDAIVAGCVDLDGAGQVGQRGGRDAAADAQDEQHARSRWNAN